MPKKKPASGLAKIAADYKKELADWEKTKKNLLELFERALELDEKGYSIEYVILTSQIVDEFLIRCIREQESLIRLQLSKTDSVSFNSDFETKVKKGFLTSGKLVFYYQRYSKDEETKNKLSKFVTDRNNLVHNIIKKGIESSEKSVSKKVVGELIRTLSEETKRIFEERSKLRPSTRELAARYLRDLEKNGKK